MEPRPLQGLRVCHFGHFDPAYARNRIVAKALARAGAEVDTVTAGGGVARRAATLVPRAVKGRYDLIVVGFPGYTDVPLALAARVPVVFDAFISQYDTHVVDRATVPAASAKARWFRLLDWMGCRLATVVLADTHAHADLLAAETGTPRERFHVLPVGADDEVMRPCGERMPTAAAAAAGAPCHVVFYGSYSPLQGTDVIVRAAARLESTGVRFTMIGDGPERANAERLAGELGATAIEFVGRVPLDELRDRLCDADIALGIFGTTPKADRVVPNKVYDALALGLAVITGDSRAVRDELGPKPPVALVPRGDHVALAAAIERLSQDPVARGELAAAAREAFDARFDIDALAGRLAEIVLYARSRPWHSRRTPS